MRVLSLALCLTVTGVAHGQSFVYVNDDALYDIDPDEAMRPAC